MTHPHISQQLPVDASRQAISDAYSELALGSET